MALSPEYVAVIVGVPTAESVYVTEHDPEDRVHVLLPVNDPVESDVANVTVPVGDDPVTVAVHVVCVLAAKDVGLQDTKVVVGAGTTCAIVGIANIAIIAITKSV